MVIEKSALIAVAEQKHFNMELFNNYLNYQKNNRTKYFGKWSVEEYAAVMMTRGTDADFFTHENLEWFANWQGFGGEDFIPDCLSFLRFCSVRDLCAYNNLNDSSVRILKKDES